MAERERVDGCIALPLTSSAEGFDVGRYGPAALGSDGLTLERPTSLKHGNVGATLGLSYARNPLIEETRSLDGTLRDTTSLIRNQLNASLGLSFGLWDRLTIHGTLPFSIVQNGDAPAAGSVLPAVASTALGDIRVGARVRLLGGLEGSDQRQRGARIA